MYDKTRAFLKKTWDFLWHSNSLASWIVNIALAFILIKFVLYPGIGFIAGTDLPVVAVISNSMEHPGGTQAWSNADAICSTGRCVQEEWYLEKNITPDDFKEFPFSRGFNKGDIMLVRGRPAQNIEVGDVVVFESGRNIPIIHRVVRTYEEEGEIFFETKGDNNRAQITESWIDERRIPEEDVLGVAFARIPYVGYVKILFTDCYRAWLQGDHRDNICSAR